MDSDTDMTEEELEEKMEQFMRSQADRESGTFLLSHILLCWVNVHVSDWYQAGKGCRWCCG